MKRSKQIKVKSVVPGLIYEVAGMRYVATSEKDAVRQARRAGMCPDHRGNEGFRHA